MPIRPELRKFYGREWRTVTRPRILERAKHRCEQCGKPNHRRVWVCVTGQGQHWTLRRFAKMWRRSRDGSKVYATKATDQSRPIRVVLTIAHLNHVSGDDRDENLKALCQWCHLNYDLLHHKETRAIRKDAGRPLLGEARA